MLEEAAAQGKRVLHCVEKVNQSLGGPLPSSCSNGKFHRYLGVLVAAGTD